VNELENRWRDLGAFIREQREMGQLSLRKLAEKAGVSNPYLSQIERGLRRPSAEILQQIAKALHISAETLYVQAGILDEPLEGPDVTGEIRRDPALSEEQKKTLIHIYQSFLGNGPPGAEPVAEPEPQDAAPDAAGQSLSNNASTDASPVR